MNTVLSTRRALVSLRAACRVLALPRASLYRYQARQRRGANTPEGQPTSKPNRPRPPNALSVAEREHALSVLNSERFADQPPPEVYARLLSEGIYLCSTRTLYRLARRRPGNTVIVELNGPHNTTRCPACERSDPMRWGPGTGAKLPTLQRGVYRCLYVVLDLFSRFVVAWRVARKENSALAKQLIQEASTRYDSALGQLTLHQDRGAPMTARGYLDLMAELDITCSHSRPRVSNDNPYSESPFKTLKQQPDYPGRFESPGQARQWCADYVDGYHFHPQPSRLADFTPKLSVDRACGRTRPNPSAGLAECFRSSP